ncbi:MAG TPA: DUF1569 domain-containing protein [Pirellulaceae bacterium]
MAGPVDTAKVNARRALRFATVGDLLTELDRLESADRAGSLRTLGNWTPGQIFGHLAAWIEYGYVGFPMGRPPWFIRWLLRRKGKKMLREGMPAGVRIPFTEHGTYGTEVLSTSDGLTRLRAALDRLQQGEPPKFDSPAFGPLSPADRLQIHLRHAELHLGFLAT